MNKLNSKQFFKGLSILILLMAPTLMHGDARAGATATATPAPTASSKAAVSVAPPAPEACPALPPPPPDCDYEDMDELDQWIQDYLDEYVNNPDGDWNLYIDNLDNPPLDEQGRPLTIDKNGNFVPIAIIGAAGCSFKGIGVGVCMAGCTTALGELHPPPDADTIRTTCGAICVTATWMGCDALLATCCEAGILRNQCELVHSKLCIN